MIKEKSVRKRSLSLPAKKRLMTVKIFTIINYSVYKELSNLLFYF